MVTRDKYNRVLVEHACPGCGSVRTVLRCLKDKHPLCKSCAAKKREARSIETSGHGRVWKGSEYFSGRIIYGWKQKAEERSLRWELTHEQLDELWDKQEGLCIFTGSPLSLNQGDPQKVSIDRIDSKQHYILDNVQFVCAYVNKAKQSRTDAEFIEMCRQVASYRR